MTKTTSSSVGVPTVPTVRVGVRQFVRLEDCRKLLDDLRQTDNALRQAEHMCEILGGWLEAHTGIDSAQWQQDAADQFKRGETC